MKGVISFLLLLIVFLSPASAQERRYMGVWQKDTGSNIITGPLSFSAFLTKGTELAQKGLRLFDVETFQSANGRRYVGLWRGGSGANLIVAPLGRQDFRKKRQEMMAKGLRLEDIEVFREPNGELKFLGVWRNGTGREEINGGLRFDDFVKSGDRLIAQGLRLSDVEIIGSGKNRRYFGLWHPGTGSNLIVGPQRAQAFAAKRKEFTEKGLQLIDLEVVAEGTSRLFVSVWGKGPAENRITMPLSFPALVSRGEVLVKQGYRMTDVETLLFETKPPPGQPGGGDTPPPGGTVSFQHLPHNVQLTDQPRLIVDFSSAIEDPPRFTIPVDYLPLLPTDIDGSIIFPDNFCGLRVKQASRFVFLKDGKVFDQFPFNNVPENSSVNAMFGANAYLGGIDFTGPIGACESLNEAWRFFSPFTQTSEGAGPPEQQVTLVIELEQGSKIEFLNFLQVKPDSLASYELFIHETEKKFKEAMNALLLSMAIDSGYCGIDQFLEESCDEAKAKGKPGECLIGADFVSPC